MDIIDADQNQNIKFDFLMPVQDLYNQYELFEGIQHVE